MAEEKNGKKRFFANILDALDKKMKDKAMKPGSCCGGFCNTEESKDENK